MPYTPTTPDQAVKLERLFHHPPQAVFDSWLDVSKVQQWWGCDMTVKTESVIEPWVGGRYEHRMTIVGHGEHLKEGTFLELEAPHRLVYSEPDGQRVELCLEARPEGTRLCLQHHNPPAAYREFMEAGWSAALTKLERTLMD